MALTEEELLLQVNILTSKTSDNPDMVYKAVAALNKGLDPDKFSGNNSKIVNAINDLAKVSANSESMVADLINKTNGILLDTSDSVNQLKWEDVQRLMDKPTIIEGLQNILEGNRQEQILGLSADDIGKVLSVAQDENGNLITKAVDMIAGGGSVSEIVAENVKYSNENFSNFTNISEAMDYALANLGNSNNSGGTSSVVNWDDIVNKPNVPNNLVLTDSQLCLQSEQGVVASVNITSDSDIDNIVDEL